MQCSLVLCLAEERQKHCLLSEECKRNIKIKKLYMCFVDIEKAFDRIPRKVMQWAMRKKVLPELIVRAVMSLYHRAKTKV